MTCLKPTGSTVREGTAALSSHRPSQRAAAQGKVHTHARTKDTSSQWPFSVGKSEALTIADDSAGESVLEKGV